MEKVKSDSKNVHSKRPLFFNVGLVFSLVFCFIAFEFKVYIPDLERVDVTLIEVPTILSQNIQPTIQKPKTKPIKEEKKNKVIAIIETQTEYTNTESSEPKIDIAKLESLFSLGAPSSEKVVDPTIYDAVESLPQYDGGLAAFYQYLAKNIIYPRRERNMGIDGKVFLQFVIEVDGSLSAIKVLKGVSKGLDEEAIRVLKATPNWIPGSNRGQPVRVRMTIPIAFQLE
ncbi:MAG: protein TonB [Marivirga sp.]|jgi:protein TonB